MMKKIINSNNGVVGIVVAVLLIGLIVAVVSLIQAVYVPKWMEEKEAEHMEQVVTQFAQLKLAIDTHVANEQNFTPIASPITLGNKELPYLMSLRAYGSLEIINNSFNIKINNDSGNVLDKSFGTIKYTSINGYFIDQSFIYENGALITSQKEGNIISMKPTMSIENTSEVIITLKMININPVGGKTNGGGYGTTSILTEYHNTIPDSENYIEIPDVENIIITTSYPNAWELFIRWSLDKNAVNYSSSFVSDNMLIINFNSDSFGNKPTVKYKIVEIYAQIGPGWIE